MTDPHLTYDELETPHEMHSDCEAVESNPRFKQSLSTINVPTQAAFVGGTAGRLTTKPLMAVSEAAAKVATKLNPFD